MAANKPSIQTGLVPGDALPPKRRLFVDHLIANKFNATQAYIDAGYATKSKGMVTSEAAKLLAVPEVQAYLQYKINEVLDRNQIEVNKDRVIRELNRLAFSNIGQVMQWTTDEATGEVTLKVRDSTELTPEELATIKKIKVTRRVTRTKDGDEYSTTTMELEQHDKMSALQVLANAAHLIKGDKPNAPNVMMNFFFGGHTEVEKAAKGRTLEHAGG